MDKEWAGEDRRDNQELINKLTKIDADLQNLHNDFNEIKGFLKGGDGKPSVDVRIDRLEQAQYLCDTRRQNQMKFVYVILGALVIEGIAVVGYLVSKGLGVA